MLSSNILLKIKIIIFTFIIILFLFPVRIYAQSCCSTSSDCPHIVGYHAHCNMHDAACNPQYICSYDSGEFDWDSVIGILTPNYVNATVGDVITDFLPYIFYISGFLILIFIVLGGFQVLTSQGDPKSMSQGRDKITYAIVGLIIIIVAYWILQLAGRILDLPGLINIFG